MHRPLHSCGLWLTAASCCLILLICSESSATSELRLSKAGQYERMLVFLEEDSGSVRASEYVDRLGKIQNGFQRASDLLENLTSGVGKRWRFGNISILVSARLGRLLTDAGLSVKLSQWERRDRVDFRISPDIEFETTEKVVAVEAICGEPGKHVLLSTESFSEDYIRSVDRKIAYFFSLYRWGLFSEEPIGDPIQPGRAARGAFRPASCSQALKTELRVRGTNRKCTYDPSTQRLSPNCSVVVSETEQQPISPASFLFAPYNSHLARFCETASQVPNEPLNPGLQHNRGADNLMNQLCHGMGAADVIRLHPDYSDEQSNAVPASAKEPVSFQIVAEAEIRRVVVVMDASGSMQLESRITKMISAVSQFVNEVLEDGAQCALINFAMTPTIMTNFITVDTPAARRQLSSSVGSLEALGGTCIGGAVIAALKLLGVDPNLPSKSVTGQLILLSDGIEGCGPQLEFAINLVGKTSVEVVTIRYGDQADPRMGMLAERSGGKQFFCETAAAQGLAGLRLSLGETTSGVSAADRTLTLSSEEIGPGFRRRVFRVDNSVGRDLAFTLSFPESPRLVSDLQLVVRAPSGREFGFGNSSDVYREDVTSGTVSVHIPKEDIQTGQWILRNTAAATTGKRRRRRDIEAMNSPKTDKDVDDVNRGGGGGILVVTGRPTKPANSESASKPPPVTTLTAEVLPSTIDLLTEQTQVGVYARLLTGYAPVLGAVVFATVRSNVSRVALLNLTDSGTGADLSANDGTYSGYMLPVDALNQARDFSISVTSTEPVSRVASAGKLTVRRRNDRFNRMMVPPARITDLGVSVSKTDHTVLLRWTAPEGNVTSYTVRCSSSGERLMRNFSACEELATVTATPGSRNLSLNIYRSLLNHTGHLFLAVAGVSAFNVVAASASNPVVVADLTREPSAEELEESLGVQLLSEDKGQLRSGRGHPWPIVVGGSVAALAAIVCLLTAVLLLVLGSRRRMAAAEEARGKAQKDAGDDNGGGGGQTEIPLLDKAQQV